MTVRCTISRTVRVAVRRSVSVDDALDSTAYGARDAAEHARLLDCSRLDLDVLDRKLEQEVALPVEDRLADDHVARVDIQARPAALEARLQLVMYRAEVDRVREVLAEALEHLLVRAVAERALAAGVVELGRDLRGEDVHLQALGVIGNEFDGCGPSRVHLGTEERRS